MFHGVWLPNERADESEAGSKRRGEMSKNTFSSIGSFGGTQKFGNYPDKYTKSRSDKIDYVANWYFKAAEFIQNTKIRCDCVSTNSIM